jgi:hypothetical protein
MLHRQRPATCVEYADGFELVEPTRHTKNKGVSPQGEAGDCNSSAEKHARFDSWDTHHLTLGEEDETKT